MIKCSFLTKIFLYFKRIKLILYPGLQEQTPCRLIEDKLTSLGLGLRDLNLGMDLTSLHRNSERPAYYRAWLCVAETALPLKGTGHRRNAHDEAVKGAQVCTHAASDLWRLQGFPHDTLPKAMGEADFHVPSARAHLTCNDARRNLTDAQETGQWVSGEAFFTTLLTSLWR